MWLCAPVTWPLGKILDCVLGHEEVVMKRRQLKAMVALHGETAGAKGIAIAWQAEEQTGEEHGVLADQAQWWHSYSFV